MNWKIASILVLFFLVSSYATSAPKEAKGKPKMQFMGAYDAGQEGVSIYKMFDPTEDVVCYLLMPETAGRKKGEDGKFIYDGNSIGSISCVKVKFQGTQIPEGVK